MKEFKYVTLEAAILPPFLFFVEQSSGHSTMDSGIASPAKHIALFKAIHECRPCQVSIKITSPFESKEKSIPKKNLEILLLQPIFTYQSIRV